MAGICLDHFIEAQKLNTEVALTELTEGKKEAIGYGISSPKLPSSVTVNATKYMALIRSKKQKYLCLTLCCLPTTTVALMPYYYTQTHLL